MSLRLWIRLVCLVSSRTTIAFLVDTIVSWALSNTPFAWYVEVASVTGATDLLFVEFEVNLNSNSPVLNTGTFWTPSSFNLWSGISKVPVTVPIESVISVPPKLPPVGLTNELTFTPSKNGKTLVFGFRKRPVNDTVRLRTNGTIPLDTTRLSITSSSKSSMTLVVIPVRIRWFLLIGAWGKPNGERITPAPDVPRPILRPRRWAASKKPIPKARPLQLFSQAFQTVPIVAPAAIWSKLPSWFVTIAGTFSVSNHSSPLGVNSTNPI